MNPIFEAYDQATKNLKAMKADYDKLAKLSKEMAKELGVKDKGVHYFSDNIRSLDLTKIRKQYAKHTGKNALTLAFIEDPDAKMIQIVATLGYSDKYESSQYLAKVKNFSEGEMTVRERFATLKPRPSAADVNREAGRFRSWRL
jgi:hypothetical protein